MTAVVLTRNNTTFTPAVGRFLWIISGFECISQIFSAKAFTHKICANNNLSVKAYNLIRLAGWERGATQILKAIKVHRKRKKRSVKDCEVWQSICSWKTRLFPLYCCCLNNFWRQSVFFNTKNWARVEMCSFPLRTQKAREGAALPKIQPLFCGQEAGETLTKY